MDAVVALGETAILRAAQSDSKVMRWYRRHMISGRLTAVYTGQEIDFKQVDYRFVFHLLIGLISLHCISFCTIRRMPRPDLFFGTVSICLMLCQGRSDGGYIGINFIPPSPPKNQPK